MKEYKKKSKNAKGITLIALVVTVVVLLILAGITINILMGENSIFAQAQAAGFKTKMSAYRDKVDLYVAWRVTEDQNTDIKTIHSGEILKELVQDEFINDIKVEDVSIPITDIIDDIGKKEEDYVVVYKGEIYYVSSGRVKDNKRQVQWCREIGIKILDYTPATGMDVVDGSYEKVNDLYLCTPNISTGLVKEKTRYVIFNDKGKMEPGDWIVDRPQENWYDYSTGKWANIYIEDKGLDCYYVWIPRYCFKLDQTGQRSDVKLIDTGNNYTDADNNTTTWEELEAQGYQVPEAFTFDGKAIPGYWAMKYTAMDFGVGKTIISYKMAVEKGIVKIDNIKVDTTITNANPIVKYTVALNGKIIETITDVNNIGSKVIQFSNLREGDNTINLTGLNAAGEIVGSMTQEYAVSSGNKPELGEFEENSTYYVTYDAKGKEHSNIPITEPFPEDWYDYGSRSWANIVTRNNNVEVYYTWIPRYQFKLDHNNENSIVEFVAKTGSAKPGYQIPDAFTYGDKELTGFWVMKYTAGDETTPAFRTETVTTNSTIRTKGITGTGVASGQKYIYYLDNVYKGTKLSATDEFEYTGLTAGKEYDIFVEIRSSSDDYLGYTKAKVKTTEPNAPDLRGFNLNQTYYVLYDEKGKNETIGEKVQRDENGRPTNMPNNWYNYSNTNGNSRWANIVVTDGTVSGGRITGAKNTTYYVWIPRYEFKVESNQYLDNKTARTTVRFINGTGTTTSKGYQIPEAFTFNNVPLTGYWAMKYTAQSLN
ncbi:MAG: hypothetical protein HFJ28_01170 [Clostridia bacterium]|nr:hypothetical protein [Clostridia bacterium]